MRIIIAARREVGTFSLHTVNYTYILLIKFHITYTINLLQFVRLASLESVYETTIHMLLFHSSCVVCIANYRMHSPVFTNQTT
jgi:hypothetical protein